MTDELRKILTDNDLMALIPVLEKQRINDIEIIAELNESDLEKIGIDKLGDRKKL
jgi:hypothetical protein